MSDIHYAIVLEHRSRTIIHCSYDNDGYRSNFLPKCVNKIMNKIVVTALRSTRGNQIQEDTKCKTG